MLGRRRGVLWLGLLALAGAEDAPPPVAPEVELDAPAEAPAPPPPVEELPPLPADLIVPKLSFSNPFNQYDNGLIPGWQYGGEATLANDYISLTPAAPNKVGWVWSDEAVSMAAWEVALEFHIGGQANRGAGGGMAFWFSAQQGRTGPIYGHEDNYEGLGVFFDTCDGGETPNPRPQRLTSALTPTLTLALTLSPSPEQVRGRRERGDGALCGGDDELRLRHRRRERQPQLLQQPGTDCPPTPTPTPAPIR